MDDIEITGALLGRIYESAPAGARREIRAAMGAILWRSGETRRGDQREEGLALRGFGRLLITAGGERSLRDAADEVSEIGGLIESASWLIGAHEDALTRREKAVAVADVNRMLGYGESE